jgi:hypothetical protein
MRLYTPGTVNVDTPNRHINESFDLAIQLIDELRRCAVNLYLRDGYYAVCDGNINPAHTWDSRDYDHVNKMTAYLWGTDEGFARAACENIFAGQIDEHDGHLRWAYQRDQRGIHVGHYCKYTADFFRYLVHGERADQVATRWDGLLHFTRWVARTYDTLGDGLIEDASPEAQGEGFLRSFWGYYIGEPEHFPVNLSRQSKPVIASMTYCGLLKQMARFAAERDLPGAGEIAAQAARVSHILESAAYSETRGYYYVQYDAFNRQWYFSINGAREDSRELLVIPYYADEVSGDPERARAVARVAHRVLRDDQVFPMPITYPPYRWYGASTEYHYHAFGMRRFLFEGCWDNSYHNCVNLLSSVGLIDVIPEAVRRRSEAACRDRDFTEWYYRDGSVGETGAAGSYHRDRYGISATAHIASIVEGLFGIRPAAPGFTELTMQPAFPYQRDRYGGANAWSDRDISITVTLPHNRLMTCRFRHDTAANTLRLGVNGANAIAHVRLPLYNFGHVSRVQLAGADVPFTLARHMDTDFVYFDLPPQGGDATCVLAD